MKPKLVIVTSELPFYSAEFINELVNSDLVKEKFNIEIWLSNHKESFITKLKILYRQVRKSGFLYSIAKINYMFQYHKNSKSSQEFKTIKHLREKVSLNYFTSLSQLKSTTSNDILLSLYFDEIIPFEVFKEFGERAINIHPSLLPEFKGSSPIFWMLSENKDYSGFTFHQITKKIDAGKVLYQEREPITNQDTFHTLYLRLTKKAVKVFTQYLTKQEFPNFQPHEKEATYFSIPDKKSYLLFKRNGRRFI